MHKPRPSIIAIDGPAASGKSTLGRRLAEALGYRFLDTGDMYRAITWAVLQQHVDVHDEPAVTRVAQECPIYVERPSVHDGRTADVLLAGEDITPQTRYPEVDANVSIVAAYRGVRLAMKDQQRHVGRGGEIVVVGRDIGTVIFPEADLKIYLVASVEERAQRRYEQERAKGSSVTYEDILRKVKERDRIDSTRDIAPLRAADDAVVIDSDGLTADQVFERVLQLSQ